MKKIALTALLATFLLSSCKDDNEPDFENDEELITTMEVVMMPSGGITEAEFFFSDPDGAGGDEAVITSDTLFSNTTYSFTIDLLDESGSETDTITDEILSEGTEHQFFYLFEPSLGISKSYLDVDANNMPIGLRGQLTIPDTTGTTEMTFILRHQPNKTARNVEDGDITNAEGDSDIEVTWEVYIQE